MLREFFIQRDRTPWDEAKEWNFVQVLGIGTPDGGNEVGFRFVLGARLAVGPGTLRAPRIVATNARAPEHG